MAATREKRVKAGAKMSRILEEEEDDDFYKTTYGGFAEEVDDQDFESNNQSDSDVVDSDFSIDENDELQSDGGDDEPCRKKAVNTKAYKEPKRDKESKPKEKKERKRKSPKPTVEVYSNITDKRSTRTSTSRNSLDVEVRSRDRETKNTMLKEMAARKNVSSVRRLTQKELLAEARITEQENLRSLEDYRKLELEKKKCRIQKKAYSGPMIRYHSVTMPLVGETSDEEAQGNQKTGGDNTTGKCSRVFISFDDDNLYRLYFPRKKVKPSQRHTCAVTKLPAKYFDPITQCPYANAKAFKVLRDAYSQELLSVGKRKKAAVKD